MGELKRIGRLVELENEEVWELDHKTGASLDPVRHRAQMVEYRGATRSVCG